MIVYEGGWEPDFESKLMVSEDLCPDGWRKPNLIRDSRTWTEGLLNSAVKAARRRYLISFLSAYGRCGLKLTGAGEGSELAQAYLKGLDGTA
jgi:hypothetical protein